MHQRPIRLLMVTPRFLPLTGGVENHVLEVSRRLAQRMDVTLLTTDTTGELPAEERVGEATVRRVRAFPRRRDYYIAPGLSRFVAEGGWDLVHVQSYHTAVAPMAMRGAVRAGVPFVLTFHGGGHSSAVRNLMRRAQWSGLRPLLARAERLVAVAEFEADFFSKRLSIPRERFAVIPNGSDLPTAGEIAAPRGGGRRVIASIGRLERYKGHHRVIAAMPAVLEQEPGVELQVVGSGPYRGELLALARRLGVADHVRIVSIPPADRAAMAEALAGFGLVVLMSEFETHPLAIIEAVALGRPAIVADSSGLSELAERGLATAIPADSDAPAIAAAIVEGLRHPRPVPRVRLPTWDDCADRLAVLYEEVLAPASAEGRSRREAACPR